LIVAFALIAGLSRLPAGTASGAGRPVFPWPQCRPLCAHAAVHGPRVTAMYVSMHETQGRAMVTIDAFAVKAIEVV